MRVKRKQHTEKQIAEDLQESGLEFRSMVADKVIFTGKDKVAGYCPDCGIEVTVSVTQLRAGNRNCACPNHSLAEMSGIHPKSSTLQAIDERLNMLKLRNESQLNKFDHAFKRKLGARIYELSKSKSEFRVHRKTRSQGLSKDACLKLLGKLPNRRALWRRGGQWYRNYLEAGGSEADLIAAHPHLESSKVGVRPEEKDIRLMAAIFLENVEKDEKYSLRQLQREHNRGARDIYSMTTRQGYPLSLVLMNLVRRRCGFHPNIRWPSKWVRKDPERYVARLAHCTSIARKVLRLEDPDLQCTAAHIDTKSGELDLSRLIKACLTERAIQDHGLNLQIIAASPGLAWDELSVTAQHERVREALLARIGFPKTLLDHEARETQLSEIVGIVEREQVKTFNQFRENHWLYYKFLYKTAQLNEFLAAVKWSGGYRAEHAGTVCKSEFEAVVANMLAIAGKTFTYDGLYPRQNGKSRRYDFHVGEPGVYIEIWMFRLDSKKRTPISTAYKRKRAEKEKFLFDNAMNPISFEVEDFYGPHERSKWVEHCHVELLNIGVLNVPLNSVQLNSCLDVTQAPCSIEESLRSLEKYFGSHDLDAVVCKAVVRVLRSLQGKKMPLTRSPLFADLPGFDPTVVFRCISAGGSAFLVRRMINRVVFSKRFSFSRYGHWAEALLAALAYRDEEPIFSTQN